VPEQQVTFEEAKLCPFCEKPGEDASSVPLPQGRGTMHLIYCRNSLCQWYNTNWFVQVRPDGTIPNRLQEKGPAEFQPRSNDFEAIGRRHLEDALKRDLRDEHP
jgi:hypothetical protein